ncbi:MAG: hypothetical protein P1U89_27110 [Verrucomicrobiales bacterium]|nr:hypothetical protein [Verrucomicrobiales bacterium]
MGDIYIFSNGEQYRIDKFSTIGLQALVAAELIAIAEVRGTDSSDFLCYITPKGYSAVENNFQIENEASTVPGRLAESLSKFRDDFPKRKTAFIMMQFGSSKAHDRIVSALKKALDIHGITALRADDKDYSDELLDNVLTYVHGCDFGIAVFERIDSDVFNPNVSLEVGYTMALQKPVCFLKDNSLRLLQTDLIGRLYRSFDPHDPEKTIPIEMEKWMRDRNIIK